jgi:hypothetical protein
LLHQEPALLQNVCPAIGALYGRADDVPHRLFDDSVRKARDLFAPSPESRSKKFRFMNKTLHASGV